MRNLIESTATKRQANFHDINMQDNGLKYLCQKETSHIQDLWISKNKLTQQGIKYFKGGDWKRLKLLVLNNNRIGNKGCLYLSSADIQDLNWLNLSENFIENSGVIHLSKSKWLKLTQLHVNKNLISLGLRYLQAANWPIVRLIDLSQNRLSQLQIIELLLGNRETCCFMIHDQRRYNPFERLERFKQFLKKKQVQYNQR